MAINPRLSIVMPMRNHDPRLMLDSLLACKIPLQIIAVDDCSEDDTVAKVEAWSRVSGQPVEILRNSRRLYSYSARLKGMARAKANIVWNVDADDVIPPNANIIEALEEMERWKPDILHCRAVGVDEHGGLQKPLTWTEPVAEELTGDQIFTAFMAMDYPPAILWNKFYSLELCRKICAEAPNLEVRYFDVKFLGLLSLLFAKTYRGSNALVYEYKMRQTRPAWLYAQQVNSLILLKKTLSPLVNSRMADGFMAFSKYCHNRLVIQTGHLSIMTTHELYNMNESQACQWLEREILTNISLDDLLYALTVSLTANAAHVFKFVKILTGKELFDSEESIFLKWKDRDSIKISDMEALDLAFNLPREIPPTSRNALILLYANSSMASRITRVLAPQTDICKKAN